MDDKQVPQTSDTPPGAQLRSDAPVGGWRGRAAQIPRRTWILIGTGAVLLVVFLALFFMLPKREDAPGGGDIFGVLPQSENSEERARVSGLSGRACEEPDRRPIGVMLSSDPITRPVSGFAQADMVFELPVLTSDVTRLLALYQCGRPDDIGSVRSARHDYLFLAEGADAIVGHWGGSYHALNRIAAGEFDSINALSNPFGAYFRKSHLPAPYNGFTTYENLWNALQKLNYRTKTEFAGYKFKDEPTGDRPSGGTLAIAWPGAFRVHYEYDAARNRYVRFWGGTKQVDGGGNREEVAPSVVAIMRAENTFADGPGGYNEMKIEGGGPLELYQDGQVIRGTWTKDERYKNDPVHFLNEAGQEITFTSGQVWVMTVEPHITVTWEPAAAPSPAGTPPGGQNAPQ